MRERERKREGRSKRRSCVREGEDMKGMKRQDWMRLAISALVVLCKAERHERIKASLEWHAVLVYMNHVKCEKMQWRM